jgi:hypothetical protein
MRVTTERSNLDLSKSRRAAIPPATARSALKAADGMASASRPLCFAATKNAPPLEQRVCAVSSWKSLRPDEFREAL